MPAALREGSMLTESLPGFLDDASIEREPEMNLKRKRKIRQKKDRMIQVAYSFPRKGMV